MMITFKDFLVESRSAPLYHATPVDSLIPILRNGISGGTYQTIYQGNNTIPHGRYGVSLTRSMRSADWYMKYEYRMDQYVVLEIDQRRVASRFKIVPVDYFTTRHLISKQSEDLEKARKEAEEFVVLNRKWDENSGKYSPGSVPPNCIVNVHYFGSNSMSKYRYDGYKSGIDKAKAMFSSVKWTERR